MVMNCYTLGVIPSLEKKLDMVSLCVPGCAGTPSLDQTGHKLGDLSTSASSVLGL